GSFLRLQGTSYILTRFGPKYKRMGVDKDGLSTGYPDDALFERSLQVLDSIRKTPYLSVYLTVTTHSPYIFDQSKQYGKLFEKVMVDRKLPESQRRYLRLYKPLWASFLFTDNCLRTFFASYRNRKEYKNTIFVITGDHHHGFFPTRNEIDDYNVPLIIYSPLLNKPVKFNAVNSHLNITPTLLAFLKDSYHLKYYPRYVPWLGNELDTCQTFRNIHRIPFMLTNRDINDYLFDNYYVGDQLYKLKPGLNLEPADDENATTQMVRIRENFKFINNYVCRNNKLFPASENIYDTRLEELRTFAMTEEHFTPEHEIYQFLVNGYKPPSDIKKVTVQVSFKLQFDSAQLELLPHLYTYIYSANNKKEFLCSTKNIYEFVKVPKTRDAWSTYSDEDMFDLDNYPDPNGHIIKVAFYNHDEMKMKIKDLTIKFLGSK
ncbi:MAG TPA: sulfatase-like hydrolase/transferase, partial [Bacteroidales bacterium]